MTNETGVKDLRVLPDRLWDLVRYCRHKLHEEGLITNEEFAALVSRGATSARRLEDYDRIRAELEKAIAERDAAEALLLEQMGPAEDVAEDWIDRTEALLKARKLIPEGK